MRGRGKKNMKLGTSTKMHFRSPVVPLSQRRTVAEIQNHPAKKKENYLVINGQKNKSN